MLNAVVAPTSRRLLSPETVQARLRLPDSDLDELAELVDEVSGLVARYLRFEPAYGVWIEDFTDVRSGVLDLGARPAWSITSVLDRAGTLQEAATYRLQRGPFGESSVLRTGSWSLGRLAPFLARYGPSIIVGGSGVLAVPDWTVTYRAGWWLEEMGPTPPDGVEPLPPEIRRDFLQVIRYFRATAAQNPTIYAMDNDGMKVTFLHRKDQVLDEDSGLPTEALFSLSKYRRAG
jgi:hypothetical protein